MKRIKAPPNGTSILLTQPVPNSNKTKLNPFLPLLQDLSGNFCCESVKSTGVPTLDSKDFVTEVDYRMLRLQFSTEAYEALDRLKTSDIKKHKKVLKTLYYMEVNLRHPSLKTHKYDSLSGPNGEDVFEAYVENRTPGAFRVFWCYGLGQGFVTILAITPHP